MRITNFGKNVSFEPTSSLVPRNREDLLACLDTFRGKRIRAVGGLHSWSEAAVANEVLLDLRNLTKITVGEDEDGSVYADLEAGCTINRALDYLQTHGGYTLPTYGIIGKQTIAGAISTATHGSGPASLSGYVKAVEVAGYAAGKADTITWTGGRELRAARCALGCSGILLSVRMPVEPDFLIEENSQWFDRIDQVLDNERTNPRLQFYLIPWRWKWFAQLRRPRREPNVSPTLLAPALRVFRLVLLDVCFNGLVRLLSGRLRWWSAIRWLYRRAFPLLARPMHVVDRSRYLLMLRHDLWTHVEMELFVERAAVGLAAAFVEWVLRQCGGDSTPMPKVLEKTFEKMDLNAAIKELSGTYVHDYPITFRRVQRDDTLISMTSGDPGQEWYAISLITYRRDLKPFLNVAAFLESTMAVAFRARPHWGKISMLKAEQLNDLYPSLADFRAHCGSFDPEQVFLNDFARSALGFAAAESAPSGN